MDTIQINSELLKKVTAQGNTEELACFLTFKFRFANSHVYCYNHEDAAPVLSHTSSYLKVYIGWMLRHGWCRFHGKHLRFNRKDELEQTEGIKGGYMVSVRFSTSKIALMRELKRVRILIDLAEQQQKADKDPKGATYLSMSNYQLQKMFGISRSAAQYLRTTMRKEKFFGFKRRHRHAISNADQTMLMQFRTALPGTGAYLSRGSIWLAMPSEIIPLE